MTVGGKTGGHQGKVTSTPALPPVKLAPVISVAIVANLSFGSLPFPDRIQLGLKVSGEGGGGGDTGITDSMAPFLCS